MKQVFKDNPSLDVCYQTADGKCFFLENDAVNHGKGLKNKKVKKLERNSKQSEELKVENEPKQEKKSTEKEVKK